MRQHYDEAIVKLQTILHREPEHVYALEYTGHCYHGLGKYDSAYIFLSRALAKGQKNYHLFVNAGDAAFKVNKAVEALNLFLMAYHIDSLHTGINYNLALVYWLKMGASDTALQYLQKELKLNTADADAYAAMGQIYLNDDDLAQALNYYNKAIDLDKKSDMLFLNRAFVRCSAGDWNEAISDFTASIHLNSKMSEAYYYRAIAYLNVKKEERACADLAIIKEGNEFSIQADSLLNIYCK